MIPWWELRPGSSGEAEWVGSHVEAHVAAAQARSSGTYGFLDGVVRVLVQAHSDRARAAIGRALEPCPLCRVQYLNGNPGALLDSLTKDKPWHACLFENGTAGGASLTMMSGRRSASTRLR